jgi:hypothetical protein
MTDLVALPEPRFTSRVDGLNRAEDCGWAGGSIKDAAGLINVRDGNTGHIEIITDEERAGWRASLQRLAINRPTYYLQYPDSLARTPSVHSR